MSTKELPEDAPGKYVPYHPEPYYSPEPLPIEPKLELPEQTRDLVADAAYQIGRVDGISSTVDFSAVLYTSLIRIEAVESARIEGADVAYQDIEAYHTKHPEGETDEPIEKGPERGSQLRNCAHLWAQQNRRQRIGNALANQRTSCDVA